MELKGFWFLPGCLTTRIVSRYLLLCLFLSFSFLSSHSQQPDEKLSLSFSNAPIEKVFKEIKKQSGYGFIYTREQLRNSLPVTLSLKSASLETVLTECFRHQPFTFIIEGRQIAIKEKSATETVSSVTTAPSINISGIVRDEKGEPVNGATITLRASGRGTSTDSRGYFELKNVSGNDILIISGIGYQTREVAVANRTMIEVALPVLVGELDEAVVIAYGTTTKRLNTGNVSKVTSKEIEKQPVSNPLAALEGRVPGVVISQSSGVPGSGFSVEIRGRSSLDLSLSRNDPLFIIDGVPFEPGNLPTNQLVSAANQPRTGAGGLSPLNTISPSDIESIEILKDADATAIYGSRGANGVILITTKKGQVGKTSVLANFYQGWSKASRTMDLLNTKQYVEMRREALANDGSTLQINTPFSNGYAPDLLIWDTTAYYDHKKSLIGNTANMSEAQISLSGGTTNTQFLIGGSYHRETNVFSDALSDRRGSVHVSLSHSSSSRKFTFQFSSLYSTDKNQLIQSDLTQYINLAPNLPLYDSSGKPNWIHRGINLSNLDFIAPASEFLKRYRSVNTNLLSNLFISYHIVKSLILSTSFGYNQFLSDEVSISPKASLNPSSPEQASSNFGNGRSHSWILEPQLSYEKTFKTSKLNLLVGGTVQKKEFNSETISASNYTNDLLLYSATAAGKTTVQNNSSTYRYVAFFNRINYNWKEKYIVNLTLRRDGSSRFSPQNRFNNFGAVGGAWLFGNERFSKGIRFLSFGKLRGSYGVTGNDQIGDYKYLDLWSSIVNTYQGIPGFQPSVLFNPNYHWERNKKAEIGLEIGFIKNRIFLTSSYFRNRSSNQLVNYKLPDQTGFSNIVQNLPAVVQNSGFEFVLTTKNISRDQFKWSSSINFTLPRNRLISFPNLASSSYSSSFQEGQPLSLIRGFKYLGVDPGTGVYTVEDVNKDGKFTAADYQVLGSSKVDAYGGLQNTFSIRNFELSVFVEGRKQNGRNYLAVLSNNQPGIARNQPVAVLNRWRQSGDFSKIQKFTDSYTSAAAFGAYYLSLSDGIYSDASFLRFKNIHLSYSLPDAWLQNSVLSDSKFYVEAQNLFVLTNYLGSDPEIKDILTLPILRTISFGLQVRF